MKVINPITDYIPKSTLTTQGDILVRGAATPDRLAVGNPNDILSVNGAGNGIDYSGSKILCSRYNNSGQSIPNNTWTTLQFPTSVYDPNSIWDTVNHRIKPSRECYLKLTMFVGLTTMNVGDRIDIDFRKNGVSSLTDFWHVSLGGLGRYGPQRSDEIYFNGTTDYADIRIRQNNGAARTCAGVSNNHKLLIHTLF